LELDPHLQGVIPVKSGIQFRIKTLKKLIGIKMKKMSVLILLASLCGMAQAQDSAVSSDTANLTNETDSKANLAPATMAITQTITKKPICLGRHHISFSWYGYSRTMNEHLKLSYLDARSGEGGFFNYRYSFNEHIDLAVDGRAHISDASDDSVKYFVKSELYYSGFGVRYNFHPRWRIFPYVQANIYETEAKINARSTYYLYQALNTFWGYNGNGWGAGINGGAEIRLGKLISIPIEVTYIYSKPKLVHSGYAPLDTPTAYSWWSSYKIKEYFNVSCFIISAGFSFKLGKSILG